MTEDHTNGRMTLRKWLQKHARDHPVHYTEIAESLGREPGSISASLSIERRTAARDERIPFFVRVAPGLYRYNDLCEGAIDEDSISKVREQANEFNAITRNEVASAIADLDLESFKKLFEIILVNVRVVVEESKEQERYGNTIIFTARWRDDGAKTPVVYYAKKCEFDETIDKETILEIRGLLPKYGANQGVIISNGIVSEEGRKVAVEPNAVVPPIHIMDKEIMLNVLFESRTGIRSKNVEVFLIDRDFFDSLRPYGSRAFSSMDTV